MLDEDEQRLFARLAVFVGGCTLATAEAVCDADLDILESLVDKSLVRVREADRFWMLETIREYALERLEDSGEGEMVQRRHAQYFLALGEEAALQTRFYSGEWIGRLELEHDNLRAALDRLAAAGEDELVLQLAGALKEFWLSGGHVAEGRQRLESALQGQKRPTAARARALTGAAAIAYSSGDVPAARSLAEQGLELHRRLDDPRGAAQGLHVLSLAAIEDGAFERGQRLVEEALALYRQAGDERDTVQATRMLAFAYVSSGDLERGRALHESNLAQAQALGFKETEAGTLGSLAMIAFHEGRLEDAAALRKQNLLAACELGSLQAIAQSLCRNASACAQIVGKAGVAARLLSFFEAQRPQIGVSESWIASVNEETLATIHTQLDEAAFAEAWEQGRLLTLEEAVALAFNALDDAS